MLVRVLSASRNQFDVVLVFLLGGVYSESLHGTAEACQVKNLAQGQPAPQKMAEPLVISVPKIPKPPGWTAFPCALIAFIYINILIALRSM